MTEKELREKVVTTAVAWSGCNGKDGTKKLIIDLYNSHTPLARGYKVTYTDSWCATFVSAVAIKCGLTDIMPTECSCSQMIALYQKLGRWQENDAYVPTSGDIIMYDWDDSGVGDCTGAPEHVGIVTSVSKTTITVIEGNKSDAVAYRSMQVNGRYIRGYCLPDYSTKAAAITKTESTTGKDEIDLTKDEVQAMIESAVKAAQPTVYTKVSECPAWAQPIVEKAQANGILNGDGAGNLHLTDDNLVNLQILANAKVF